MKGQFHIDEHIYVPFQIIMNEAYMLMFPGSVQAIIKTSYNNAL